MAVLVAKEFLALQLNWTQFFERAVLAFFPCGKQAASVVEVQMRQHHHIDVFVAQADPVSYTHLTLPTTTFGCRSRWGGEE